MLITVALLISWAIVLCNVWQLAGSAPEMAEFDLGEKCFCSDFCFPKDEALWPPFLALDNKASLSCSLPLNVM